jgi:hypothetical protein
MCKKCYIVFDILDQAKAKTAVLYKKDLSPGQILDSVIEIAKATHNELKIKLSEEMNIDLSEDAVRAIEKEITTMLVTRSTDDFIADRKIKNSASVFH